MLHLTRSLILLAVMSESANVLADQVRSPEVHADRTVTFRLKSEAATKVELTLFGNKLALANGAEHIWSVTTEPLPPGIHDYGYIVDGTRMIDPSNRNVKKWFSLASMVEIPGSPPSLTEFQNVPHGVIQRMIYSSTAVEKQRPVMVYTPPGYDRRSNSDYPLVILLHGFGDDETAWTEVGRAHLVADNLIAADRIRPCVIAMPYGHPVPAPYAARPNNYFADNNELYEKDIVLDLLPFLEEHFCVRADAASRSIVGLSMGGGHAIDTGLKHVDKFSSIGAFSAVAPQLHDDELLALYPALQGQEPQANGLKSFWIPIGDRDFLLDRNDKFVAFLKRQGVQHRYTKTDGGHEWTVWRKYLPEFLEMAVAPEK